jgi:CGNR zinc finger
MNLMDERLPQPVHGEREDSDAEADIETEQRLNAAAAETWLPRFDEPCILPTVDGLRGAIGGLLGVAFLAELDGSWHRFQLFADPTCTTVFYDRSKNHSARWCSMQTCGNRNKVRAFRQRHTSTA